MRPPFGPDLRPNATRVAGFHTWRSLGRFVRKGEKGIVILAPIVGRRSDAEADDPKQAVGFRAAYVFDVAQTDGETFGTSTHQGGREQTEAVEAKTGASPSGPEQTRTYSPLSIGV